MSSPRLRLGMIGGGPGAMIGPIHRIAARLDDRFVLRAGAFSSDAGKSRDTGARLGLDIERVYGDWQSMIDEEGRRSGDRLDAIAIVTPNHLHAAPAIAALEAGFHVLCDKPVATTIADAEAIAAAARASGRLFVLTHTYSGYPMVREMREMVRAGQLGALRIVQVSYAQDWLAQDIENSGNKQAAWRTDAAQAGAGGALGDIATHAYHLAGFVTGLRADALCADLSAFGAGRTLDDNVGMLLRYPGGVRAMLWASQVAPGRGNDLRLGIWGDEGGVEWSQEDPNRLRFSRIDEPTRIIERGGPGVAGGPYLRRLPPSHPEGYLEAFAQLYSDAADSIQRWPKTPDDLIPNAEDGIEGLRFVAGAIASHAKSGWIERAGWC